MDKFQKVLSTQSSSAQTQRQERVDSCQKCHLQPAKITRRQNQSKCRPHTITPHPTPCTKRSCTCPKLFQPQQNKPPDDPTIAHVCDCARTCQLQTFKYPQQAFNSFCINRIPRILSPHHRSNPSHPACTPFPLPNIKPHPTAPTERII